jgi:enamine deaminase RidA (YjgF/YER057c/UK114 family)
MTTPRERLAELGVNLPPVTPPVAAYIPAVRTGNHVYVSGQVPVADGKVLATGKVGGEITPDQAKDLAARCALNILAAVDDLVGLDHVVRVVKVVGFVASADGFTEPASSSWTCSATPDATRAVRSACSSCRWAYRSKLKRSSKSTS